MLNALTLKEKMSGFRQHPLLLLSIFCFMAFSSHAEAADSKVDLAALGSSVVGSCKCSDSDSDHCKKESDNKCKRICCPGPKGDRGPRGPEGAPACPGAFTDFASYQLIFLPGQSPLSVAANTAIPFQRQSIIKGKSISSVPPFSSFKLKAGTYEITVAISNINATNQTGPVGFQNQLQLKLSNGATYTFAAVDREADFITFSKIVQVFVPTSVQVVTTHNVTFTPEADQTGLGGYINFIRLQ
jgi:hypothetical protein